MRCHTFFVVCRYKVPVKAIYIYAIGIRRVGISDHIKGNLTRIRIVHQRNLIHDKGSFGDFFTDFEINTGFSKDRICNQLFFCTHKGSDHYELHIASVRFRISIRDYIGDCLYSGEIILTVSISCHL